MINNEAGIKPTTSSIFVWTFVLSSVCFSTTFPSLLPPLTDVLGGQQPRLLYLKHQLGSLEAAAPVDMKDLGQF